MIRNTSLGIRVRVCIYYSKVKCRLGYCVVLVFVSRFMDCHYFFSAQKKNELHLFLVAVSHHH